MPIKPPRNAVSMRTHLPSRRNSSRGLQQITRAERRSMHRHLQVPAKHRAQLAYRRRDNPGCVQTERASRGETQVVWCAKGTRAKRYEARARSACRHGRRQVDRRGCHGWHRTPARREAGEEREPDIGRKHARRCPTSERAASSGGRPRSGPGVAQPSKRRPGSGEPNRRSDSG